MNIAEDDLKAFDYDEEKNIYTCKDSKYLFFDDTNTKASCLSFGDCMKSNVVAEATKQCLTEAQCIKDKFIQEVGEGNTL